MILNISQTGKSSIKSLILMLLVALSLNACFNKEANTPVQRVEQTPKTEISRPEETTEAYYTKEARYKKTLGDRLAEQNDYEAALELYEKAINTDPNFYPALKAIGEIYERQGNLDLTEKYYKETTTINNQDPVLFYKLGNIATLKNNYDEAIQYYDKAISIVPDFFEAYRNKGLVYKRKHQPEKALQAYEKAREINPQDKKNLLNIGNIYAIKCPEDKGFMGLFKKGYCQQAIEAYQKAIKSDKNYVDAYVNLSYLYIDTKQKNKAKKTITKGLEVDPDNVKLRSLLEEIKFKASK